MDYNGQQFTLDTPRVLVIMADGSMVDVQCEHPDLAMYDLERAKRKWPSIQEGPIWWLSWVAYSKLKRSGQLPDPKAPFEAWLLTTAGVKNLDEDGRIDELVATVGPTPEGPAPT